MIYSGMPRLDDPKEWAIIREMYFGGMHRVADDIDPLEKWDRMQSKKINKR